jgi:ERCC4-type nuclease
MTDRSIVASSEVNPASPIVQKYGHPFHLVSAELPTADYWLVGPQGPVAGFVGIERKERDLASSLTAEMPRFKEECDRLRTFTNPAIVTSSTLASLINGSPQHEAAFVGGLAVIAARYRIPVIMCADRGMAERFAARMLVEWWQSWLAVNPDVLAWAREEERRRGIVREQRRKQRREAG